MLSNAPVITLLAPFFAAFAVCGFGLWKREIAQPVAILGLSVSLLSSLLTLSMVNADGPITYSMGGWSVPYGIVFSVDLLNALIAVLIQLVGLITMIHGGVNIHLNLGQHRHFFYAIALLFITGITGITQSGDAFNLYVLIEVASLTSYAMIAVGDKRSLHAGLNYLLIGSIGATFYLLGVGYLYIKTGTLNMHDIHAVLVDQNLFQSATVQVSAVMIFVGLWIKMALFPFHGWLPNAYTWSPTASASLMGSLMSKVMIYVMIRFMITIFGLNHILEFAWASVIPHVAVAAILYGSAMALSQRNLRRIVTYLIVAEVGYMVGAAWLGTDGGLIASFYHILSDSLMTLSLMMVAGSLIYRHGIRNIDDFQGAYKKMPLTMTVFTVGALSMVGIPPTCGFFSKWLLISSGIDAGNWIYIGSLLISSFVNAVIFFRIFEIAYFGKEPASGIHGHEAGHPASSMQEVPVRMVIPPLVVSILIVLLGVFNQVFVEMIQETITTLTQVGAL